MNTIDNANARATIEEEAGAWVIKLDGDSDLSAEQREAFKAWMGRSPAHREAVKNLAQFWGKMNVLTELAMPQQLHPVQPEQRPPSAGWGFAPRWAAALSVCLLVGMVWLQIADTGQTPNGLYATAIGQQKNLVLNDGSELQLNTNSQVEIYYSNSHRDIVLLQGEAHFVVAKNKDRPFRVTAGQGVVQALGTAFSVYLNRDDIEVTLTEGRVALASRSSTASAELDPAAPSASSQTLGEMNAGQRAVIKAVVAETGREQTLQATIEAVSQQELNRSLSWRKGFVIFKGARLDQVVAEVGRYSRVAIELTDPELAAIPIGGQFRVGEIAAILESLEQNFGLEVKHLAYNHVQISAADPAQ